MDEIEVVKKNIPFINKLIDQIYEHVNGDIAACINLTSNMLGQSLNSIIRLMISDGKEEEAKVFLDECETEIHKAISQFIFILRLLIDSDKTNDMEIFIEKQKNLCPEAADCWDEVYYTFKKNKPHKKSKGD